MGKKARVICPYCTDNAVLFIDSTPIYGRNRGAAWACLPCRAWVGTHQNSKNHAPLGRLANAELRAAKVHAHAAFDPLWKRKIAEAGSTKHEARDAAYTWLANQLSVRRSRCHIGHFDLDQCRRVVEICAPYQRAAA